MNPLPFLKSTWQLILSGEKTLSAWKLLGAKQFFKFIVEIFSKAVLIYPYYVKTKIH